MATTLLRSTLQFPWSYGVMQDGRIFFINDEKCQTTWIHPHTGHVVQTGQQSLPEFPSGWERGVTPEGAAYYIDHKNRETTFFHPISGKTAADSETPPSVTRASTPPPLQGGSTRQEAALWRRSSSDNNVNRLTNASEHPPVVKRASAPANSNAAKNAEEEQTPPRLSRKARVKSVSTKPLKSPLVKRSEEAPVTMRGWLYKQDHTGLKQWKRRWCVLSDFCLFYYKDAQEKELLGSVLLPSYKITSDEKVNRKYAFKAEHQNMRTYFFAAETKEEMVKWMNALSLASILMENMGIPKQRTDEYNGKLPLRNGDVNRQLSEDDEVFLNYVPRYAPAHHDLPSGYPGHPDGYSSASTAQDSSLFFHQGTTEPRQTSPSKQRRPAPHLPLSNYSQQLPPNSYYPTNDEWDANQPMQSDRTRLTDQRTPYMQFQSLQTENGFPILNDKTQPVEIKHHEPRKLYLKMPASHDTSNQYPRGTYAIPPQTPPQEVANAFFSETYDAYPLGQVSSQKHSAPPPGHSFENRDYMDVAPTRDRPVPPYPGHSSPQKESQSRLPTYQHVPDHNSNYHIQGPKKPQRIAHDRNNEVYSTRLPPSQSHYDRSKKQPPVYQERRQPPAYRGREPLVYEQQQWQGRPNSLPIGNRGAPMADKPSPVSPQRTRYQEARARVGLGENQMSPSSVPVEQQHFREKAVDVLPAPRSQYQRSASYSVGPRHNEMVSNEVSRQPIRKESSLSRQQASSQQYRHQPSHMERVEHIPYQQHTSQPTYQPAAHYESHGAYDYNQSSAQMFRQPSSERPQESNRTSQPPTANVTRSRQTHQPGPGERPGSSQSHTERSQSFGSRPQFQRQSLNYPADVRPISSLSNLTPEEKEVQRQETRRLLTEWKSQKERSGSVRSLNRLPVESHPPMSQVPHSYNSHTVPLPSGRHPNSKQQSLDSPQAKAWQLIEQERQKQRQLQQWQNSRQQQQHQMSYLPVNYHSGHPDQKYNGFSQDERTAHQIQILESREPGGECRWQPEYFNGDQFVNGRGQQYAQQKMNGDVGVESSSSEDLSGTTRKGYPSLGVRAKMIKSNDDLMKVKSNEELPTFKQAGAKGSDGEDDFRDKKQRDGSPRRIVSDPFDAVSNSVPEPGQQSVSDSELDKQGNDNTGSFGLTGPYKDLMTKSHEELVLLLIQLRRNLSAMQNARDFYRSRMIAAESRVEHLPDDQVYEEWRNQKAKLDEKIQTRRPLVDLVDNLVKVKEEEGEISPFTTTDVSVITTPPLPKQQNSAEYLDILKEVEKLKLSSLERKKRQETTSENEEDVSYVVKLQEYVRRLGRLNSTSQELAFSISSLHEDKELMERALGGLEKRANLQQGAMVDSIQKQATHHQQSYIEVELDKVNQRLEEKTQQMKDALTEHCKVEGEVWQLKAKLQHELSNQYATGSTLMVDSVKAANLESDLAKVNALVEGLAKTKQRLHQQNVLLEQLLSPHQLGVKRSISVTGTKQKRILPPDSSSTLPTRRPRGIKVQLGGQPPEQTSTQKPVKELPANKRRSDAEESSRSDSKQSTDDQSGQVAPAVSGQSGMVLPVAAKKSWRKNFFRKQSGSKSQSPELPPPPVPPRKPFTSAPEVPPKPVRGSNHSVPDTSRHPADQSSGVTEESRRVVSADASSQPDHEKPGEVSGVSPQSPETCKLEVIPALNNVDKDTAGEQAPSVVKIDTTEVDALLASLTSPSSDIKPSHSKTKTFPSVTDGGSGANKEDVPVLDEHIYSEISGSKDANVTDKKKHKKDRHVSFSTAEVVHSTESPKNESGTAETSSGDKRGVATVIMFDIEKQTVQKLPMKTDDAATGGESKIPPTVPTRGSSVTMTQKLAEKHRQKLVQKTGLSAWKQLMTPQDESACESDPESVCSFSSLDIGGAVDLGGGGESCATPEGLRALQKGGGGLTVRDVKRRSKERQFIRDQEPDRLSDIVDPPSLLDLTQTGSPHSMSRLPSKPEPLSVSTKDFITAQKRAPGSSMGNDVFVFQASPSRTTTNRSAQNRLFPNSSNNNSNGEVRLRPRADRRNRKTAHRHTISGNQGAVITQAMKNHENSRTKDDMDLRDGTPDLVKSTVHREHEHINPLAIDLELSKPSKVRIPERLEMEPERLTPEQVKERKHKAESIRKMLLNSESMNLTAPEPEEVKPAKTEILKEKREREKLLNLNQMLAAEVKEIAARNHALVGQSPTREVDLIA